MLDDMLDPFGRALSQNEITRCHLLRLSHTKIPK